VLISHDVDYQALAGWLDARLQPGLWTQWARQPGLGRPGLGAYSTRTRRAARVHA
jgi:hypothetical protein